MPGSYYFYPRPIRISVSTVAHKSLFAVFYNYVPQNGALADIQLVNIVDHGAALDR